MQSNAFEYGFKEGIKHIMLDRNLCPIREYVKGSELIEKVQN